MQSKLPHLVNKCNRAANAGKTEKGTFPLPPRTTREVPSCQTHPLSSGPKERGSEGVSSAYRVFRTGAAVRSPVFIFFINGFDSIS
jgi:hypothetical protein